MTKKPTRKQPNKHLKDILLLFSVPAGIIFIIVAFLYIPRLLANPSYDFIYCSGSNCSSRYTVDSSDKLTANESSSRYVYDDALHYYDVSRDATRRLTLGEAQNYRLDAASKSPDGYSLEMHRHSGGPFTSSYHDSWSLKKGALSKPVTLSNGSSDRYYYGSSGFVGWVLSDE